MEYFVLLVAVGWLFIGLIGYGLIYSWFVNKYYDLEIKRKDFLFLILTGPSVFLVSLFFLVGEEGAKNMFKHGIKF